MPEEDKDVFPSIPLSPDAVELQGTGITEESLLRRGAARDSEGSVAIPVGSL